MSKYFFKSFLSTLLAVLMIASLCVVPSSAATVKLNKSSISLTKGYSTTLSVSGTSSAVTWSTGNKNVATVSSKGKVVGKKVGSTYIYAKVNSTTLKCKVKVVAGKISVGESSVELEQGDTEKVQIKAIGTHSISVKSMNTKVVKATWAGAKFSGDKINLTLKAVGSGTARVKVYAKNYPDTIYKYITVTVDGDDDDDTIIDDDNSTGSTTTTGRLSASVSSVTVNTGESQTFTVYAPSASELSNLRISSTSVLGFNISVSADTTKNALIVKITGLNEETGSVKIYSTQNSKLSLSIPVTVKSTAQYYTLLTTKPTSKILTTDTVIAFQNGTTAYYMLVPYGYDPAYANSVAAKALNSYSYNLVYDTAPTKKLNNDEIVQKTVNFNGASQVRYVLAPYGYDSAFVDTIFAKYSGVYDYYTVYSEKPTSTVFSDEVLQWTVSTTTTSSSTRYMLVPFGYDQTKVDSAKNKYEYSTSYVAAYEITSTLPNVDTKVYKVIQWKKNNANRYMAVPINNCDYIKRNDLVRKDVGYFSYYVAYSEAPTVSVSDTEAVYSLTLQNSKGELQNVYILYNPKDSDYQKKIDAAINYDSDYIGVKQGSLT